MLLNIPYAEDSLYHKRLSSPKYPEAEAEKLELEGVLYMRGEVVAPPCSQPSQVSHLSQSEIQSSRGGQGLQVLLPLSPAHSSPHSHLTHLLCLLLFPTHQVNSPSALSALSHWLVCFSQCPGRSPSSFSSFCSHVTFAARPLALPHLPWPSVLYPPSLLYVSPRQRSLYNITLFIVLLSSQLDCKIHREGIFVSFTDISHCLGFPQPLWSGNPGTSLSKAFQVNGQPSMRTTVPPSV